MYREYFCREGWAQNKVYPGIPELLGALKNAGKKLYVATSKPEPFAVHPLKDQSALLHRKSHHLFSRGFPPDQHRRCRQKIQPDIVMVGDREHDIIGAGEQGLESIGVLYGYGSRRELEESEAARIAESVEALRAILLGEML